MNSITELIEWFFHSDDRLFWALAQVSLIAITAYVLVVVARKIRPASRVYISLLGLLLMALTPVSTLTQVGRWSWGELLPNSPPPAAVPISDTAQDLKSAANAPPESLTAWQKVLISTTNVFVERKTALQLSDESSAASVPSQRDSSVVSLVFSSVILCIAFGMLRLSAGYWQIRGLRRAATPIFDKDLHEDLARCIDRLGVTTAIRVHETTTLGSAAVIGWLKPLLLLPRHWRTWTTEERCAVLAHELAHVKRNDFLSTAIGQLAMAVNFYHPLAHVVLHRLRLDQELAADSLASQVVGGQQRYVELLAGLALRQRKARTPGPCQAFLPPRRMFVRRLEMLRSLPKSTRWLNRCYSVLATITLVGIAMVATGLRPHFVIAQETRSPNEGTPAQGEAAVKSLASYLPDGLCEAVALVDAQSVLNSAGILAVKQQADLPSEFELPGQTLMVDDVDQVLLAMTGMQSNGVPLLIFRTHGGLADNEPNPQTRLLASNTLAVCESEEILQLLGLASGEAKWESLLNRNADASVRIATNTAWMQALAAQDRGGPTMALAPLWENVRTLSAGIDLGDDLQLKAQIDASDPKKVSETLTALRWLARNYLERLPVVMREQGVKDTTQLVIATTAATAGTQFLDSLQIEDDGQQLNLEAELSDSVYPMIALMMPAISSARTAALRTQSTNNMKMLMLAMHNYHAAFGRLPSAVVVDEKSGQERSWRVELLPFLEHQNLYERYKKNEPWDSAANQEVLSQMPPVFAVAGETGTQVTPYQAIVSEGGGLTLTKAGKAPTFRDFIDGTANTVVIAETKLLVPWTKPIDLVADAQTPELRTVREADPGILVGMADGTVRFLSEHVDASVWQGLITRDGREAVNLFR